LQPDFEQLVDVATDLVSDFSAQNVVASNGIGTLCNCRNSVNYAWFC